MSLEMMNNATDTVADTSEAVAAAEGEQVDANLPATPGEQVEGAESSDATEQTAGKWELSDEFLDKINTEPKAEETEESNEETEKVKTQEEKPQENEPESEAKAETQTKEESQEKTKAEEKDVVSQVEEELSELDEKLNWESAKPEFRDGLAKHKESIKKLTEEVLSLKKDSLGEKYLLDTSAFLEEIQNKSSTQYKEIEQQIADKVANENPQGWADFLAKNHPEALAKSLMGDERWTKEKIQAVLDYAEEEELDLDSWDLPETQSDLTSEERQELEELRKDKSEQESKAEVEANNQIYSEMVAPLQTLVEDIQAQYQLNVTKDDTPEEKAFKEFIDEVTPHYILNRLQTDEKVKTIFEKANEFVKKGDRNGALGFQLDIKNYVDSLITNAYKAANYRIAKEVEERQTPKVEEAPPKTVSAKVTSTPASATNEKAVKSEYAHLSHIFRNDD